MLQSLLTSLGITWEIISSSGIQSFVGYFVVHFTLVVTFEFSWTDKFYSFFYISLQFVKQFQICSVWADAF